MTKKIIAATMMAMALMTACGGKGDNATVETLETMSEAATEVTDEVAAPEVRTEAVEEYGSDTDQNESTEKVETEMADDADVTAEESADTTEETMSEDNGAAAEQSDRAEKEASETEVEENTSAASEVE